MAQRTPTRRRATPAAKPRRAAKRAKKTREQLEDERDLALMKRIERERGPDVPWEQLKRERGLA